MKPFNLEEALAGKPVQTRNGQEVTQIVHFKYTGGMPIRAVVNDTIHSFTKEGSYFPNKVESELDLFMKSEKKTGFVNIYKGCTTNYVGGPHETKDEAISKASSTLVDTVQIEWEE